MSNKTIKNKVPEKPRFSPAAVILPVVAALLVCFLMLVYIPVPPAYAATEEETNFVEIVFEGRGSVIVELYPDTAPITVRNFKDLVAADFYDGIIIHRVVDGFVIQGGDPEGTGYGGSEKTIIGEFLANRRLNPIEHLPGVISMARSGNSYDSASSQFFICIADDRASLDGLYAAFGKVVYGYDVCEKIGKVATNSNDKPLSPVVMTEVRFVEEKELSFVGTLMRDLQTALGRGKYVVPVE